MSTEAIVSSQVDSLRATVNQAWSVSDLSIRLASLDYGLLDHACVTVRKMAMILMYAILRKLFKAVSDAAVNEKTKHRHMDTQIVIRGPFEVTKGVLNLVNRGLNDEVAKAISTKIDKWRQLNTTTYKLFCYTTVTSSGNTLLLGLDEHRLFEMLDNRRLLITLPDPSSTNTFIDLECFGAAIRNIKFDSYHVKSLISNQTMRYLDQLSFKKLDDLSTFIEGRPCEVAQIDNETKLRKSIKISKRSSNSVQADGTTRVAASLDDEKLDGRGRQFKIKNSEIKGIEKRRRRSESRFGKIDNIVIPGFILDDNSKKLAISQLSQAKDLETHASIKDVMNEQQITLLKYCGSKPTSAKCSTSPISRKLRMSSKSRGNCSPLLRMVLDQAALSAVLGSPDIHVIPRAPRLEYRSIGNTIENTTNVKKTTDSLFDISQSISDKSDKPEKAKKGLFQVVGTRKRLQANL